VVGNVTICGDASQPQSRNLGQGGCMALEDAIVLARKLEQNTQVKRKLNLQGAQVRTDPTNIVGLPPRKAWKYICSHTKLT
jgi:2-polyprenyl-6-methoxyphenol hydroxylase-like FAD-dependent oxidoreductase